MEITLKTHTVRTVVITPLGQKKKYKPAPTPAPPKSMLAQIVETLIGLVVLVAILFGMHACQSGPEQFDWQGPAIESVPRAPSGDVFGKIAQLS